MHLPTFSLRKDSTGPIFWVSDGKVLGFQAGVPSQLSSWPRPIPAESTLCDTLCVSEFLIPPTGWSLPAPFCAWYCNQLCLWPTRNTYFCHMWDTVGGRSVSRSISKRLHPLASKCDLVGTHSFFCSMLRFCLHHPNLPISRSQMACGSWDIPFDLNTNCQLCGILTTSRRQALFFHLPFLLPQWLQISFLKFWWIFMEQPLCSGLVIISSLQHMFCTSGVECSHSVKHTENLPCIEHSVYNDGQDGHSSSATFYPGKVTAKREAGWIHKMIASFKYF